MSSLLKAFCTGSWTMVAYFLTTLYSCVCVCAFLCRIYHENFADLSGWFMLQNGAKIFPLLKLQAFILWTNFAAPSTYRGGFSLLVRKIIFLSNVRYCFIGLFWLCSYVNLWIFAGCISPGCETISVPDNLIFWASLWFKFMSKWVKLTLLTVYFVVSFLLYSM